MSQTPRKLSLAEITAIGIGGMIGGGIFAVLGLAIDVAGHAVALTMAGGGIIALLTGLSYAQLGLTFKGDGGSFTYIEKAFAAPFIARLTGWLLVVGYIGTLALYANAFGDYGASLVQGTHVSPVTGDLLSTLVMVAFVAINLIGAKLSGGVELGIVATKLSILALFAIVGLIGVHLSHFKPVFNNGTLAPVTAIALIFVAYEGFELIPNAIDEMAHPERDLRRALILAIVITAGIYIVVALAALGNLTPHQIRHDQEYVLAVAARPTLGQAGFILIGIAALLSTASAINATLFGAARLAMVMAQKRTLPQVFSLLERSRPIPYVALLVLAVLAIAFTLVAPLPLISAFASATFLLIFAFVNFAALKLAKKIKLHPLIPLAGGVLATASFIMLIWHTILTDLPGFITIVTVYTLAVIAETVLQSRDGTETEPQKPT